MSAPAERTLWFHLRNRKLGGFKFRRQHPIGTYVADFYCEEVHLVVELDGPSHEQRGDYDDKRSQKLWRDGYRIVRVFNFEIHDNVQGVLRVLLEECEALRSGMSVTTPDAPSPAFPPEGAETLPSPEGRGDRVRPTRRQVLQGMAGAAASLAFVELATMIPAAGATAATTQESAMTKMPLPLEESITESHVGSLYGPIRRIRDAYGWATESFTSDKYKPADHPAWRQKMKDQVFASMKYAPAKCDFAAETVEKVDCGKYTREKVYFNTTPELRVPAYVLVPKGLTGKAPAIVALHDHGGFFRFGKEKLVKIEGEHPSLAPFKTKCYAGRNIADDLAEQGYVVIVIDMFYWGERRMRTPQDPATGPNETVADVQKFNASRSGDEQLVARTIYTSGFTWAGLIFWDDMRTVDYLLSRPEVDPSRIGCVGLSVGAWRVNHLMAFDERVKAGVAVCWMTSFQQIQARHTIWTVGFTKLLPGIYRQLDMPDVVSLAAPRPLLAINGTKDVLFNIETGVKPAYKTLEAVYAKIGAAEKFKGHIYESPHEFNAEMQQEAWDWLKRWV